MGARYGAALGAVAGSAGEGDVDGQAAAGLGLRGDGGGVRCGDGADNGEAQAVTAVAAGGARAEPLEGLEQAVDLGGRDDLPGAGHRQDGVTVGGPGGDLDVSAGDVVPDGVVDQVGGQLLDQERVTVEYGGLDVGLDVQALAADRVAGGGQGFAGDGRQVGGPGLAGAGFAAGQGEHRLDEAFLLGVGGEQVPADGLPGGGGGGGIGEGDLEQGAFPGQGGAQLVRGVGGEAPLGAEGGFQPREQVVEGVGEFLELVVGSVQSQPLVQAASGDPAGGGGDRAQRAQHPAGDEPADRGGGHRDDRQGDSGGDQQLLPVEGDLSQTRHLDLRLCLQDEGLGDFDALGGVHRSDWGVRLVPEQAVDQVGNGEHGRGAGQEHRRAV